jgi:ornithine cyclodeaminase
MSPRPSIDTPGGVIELMPIRSKDKHVFKYVTSYPRNPDLGYQTVVALGQLSNVATGYPLMVAEMSAMTALRTAVTTALATSLMARKSSRVMAMIGTGAQSEFQVRVAALLCGIDEIHYFDTDSKAMDKFAFNMQDHPLKLVRCKNVKEAVKGADIITTCTANMGHHDVLKNDWVKPGVHINAIGGDCPDKTELEVVILPRARLVTDYFEQAITEGEIQRFSRSTAKSMVYAELHDLVTGHKQGRHEDEEITIYDSVGMALEDYSALCLTYRLAKQYKLGEHYHMLPMIDAPKDLISSLQMKL